MLWDSGREKGGFWRQVHTLYIERRVCDDEKYMVPTIEGEQNRARNGKNISGNCGLEMTAYPSTAFTKS